VKLGGQRDCRNFGQKVDNAKAKGERKKARGASMTLKLPRSGRPTRERVMRLNSQERPSRPGDLLGAASSNAAVSSGSGKGTSSDSVSSGGRRGKLARKVGKWVVLGEKGTPEPQARRLQQW
jgi:hypothetical protein